MTHLRKSLALLLLPCAELSFLRLYLHSALQLKVGWFHMTDFDLVVPALLAFSALVFTLEKSQPKPVTTQKKMLTANLVALSIFIFGNSFLRGSLLDYDLWVLIAWWVGLFFISFSAFCSFTPVSYYFSRSSLPATVSALLLSLSVVLNANLLRWFWPTLMKPVGSGARFISELLTAQTVVLHPSETAVILVDPRFAVKINQACGGGDGLFLFIFSFSLFCLIHGKLYSGAQKILFGLVGCLTMICLNILRIGILFWIGSGFSTDGIPFGQTKEYKLFFHTNVGWILYFAGLVLLFRLFLSMAHDSKETVRQGKTLNPSTV